jgi:hypothetical protein
MSHGCAESAQHGPARVIDDYVVVCDRAVDDSDVVQIGERRGQCGAKTGDLGPAEMAAELVQRTAGNLGENQLRGRISALHLEKPDHTRMSGFDENSGFLR